MGSVVWPHFHREGDKNDHIFDRYVYFIYQTPNSDGTFPDPDKYKKAYYLSDRPNDIQIGRPVDPIQPGAQIGGNAYLLYPHPEPYYILVSKNTLTDAERNQLTARHCKKVVIRSKAQKGSTTQHIALFDSEIFTTHQKLRLGVSNQSVSSPDSTLLKLYIPAETGGDLTVTLSSPAEISVYYIDGKDDNLSKVTVGQGDNRVAHQTGSDTLTYSVPQKQTGWHFIWINTTSARQVSNTFTHTTICREGTSNWRPWNFWYYPFDYDLINDTRIHAYDTDGACEHFDTNFNVDSLAWEEGGSPLNSAGGHKSINVNGTDGHCDDASLASIMFLIDESRLPSPITLADAKLFATEYCRSACDTRQIYKKNGVPYGVPMPWKLPDSGKNIIPVQRAAGAPQDETDKNVGTFHQMLVDRLTFAKEPVLIDLGDAKGTDSSEVWNHAVYRMDLTYAEYTGSGSTGEKDILISNVLEANLDHQTLQNDSTKIRRAEFEYRVVFDSNGKTKGSTHDDWRSSRSGSTNLFAPRFITYFYKFRIERRDGVNQIGLDSGGNIEMCLDRLESIGITLRSYFTEPAKIPEYGVPLRWYQNP
ncbi:MAG: hypothetical protein JW863_15050 [Chitinispirillaceae bacterium]|nr:hypothetical protein [Chitinispirillaceae bacterium]